MFLSCESGKIFALRLSIPNQYVITEDRNFPERGNIHYVGVEKGVEDGPPLHPWIMDQELSLDTGLALHYIYRFKTLCNTNGGSQMRGTPIGDRTRK